MQTTEYERLVLHELRQILMEPGGQAENLARQGSTHGGVRVEDVRLEGPGPEREIGILFRDLGRPECLLGYRIGALEPPDVLYERINPYLEPASAPRGWAENVWVLFEEEISAAGCGLPNDCSPEGVTWIG